MPVTLQHSHSASQKPHANEYRFTQDLRAINNIAQDINPVVLNPYTLLMVVPGDSKRFSVLVLKEAFFCNRLSNSLSLNGRTQKLKPHSNTAGLCCRED